jgi:hypothetical protein
MGYESEQGGVIPTGYESERGAGVDHARHGDPDERRAISDPGATAGFCGWFGGDEPGGVGRGAIWLHRGPLIFGAITYGRISR